jgi:hypothetical protein
MPRGDPRSAIAESVTKGIIKAASSWEKMSGESLASAPESYTSAVVAQTLFASLTKSYVCLEWGTALTLREARKSPKRGRPRKRLDGNKRFDLVVFYQNGRARCAIEIKHLVNNGAKLKYNKHALNNDLKRLQDAISEREGGNSSLAQGCLGIYLECGTPTRGDKTPKERIERWIDKIIEMAEAALESSGQNATMRSNSEIGGGNGSDGAYAALVIDLHVPVKRGSAEG